MADFAKEYNLTVESSSADRRTVQLSGSVEQMNKAFGVQLNTYEYPGGTFRSREGHVMVPRALSDVVKRVSGLTNRPLARPHVQFRPLIVTEFDAVQIGQMYDFPTGVTGAGTCIGIIELGGAATTTSTTGRHTATSRPATPTSSPAAAPRCRSTPTRPWTRSRGTTRGSGGPRVAASATGSPGLIALLNESFGFPLGFITPFIYSLYQTNAFVDITKGTNQIYPAPGYSAGAGWDACTGLGRIDGKNLLTELQ